MADFSTIKQEIDENIVPFNDAQEITGEKLNVTLKDMLDAVADAIDAGFQFLGILPEEFDPSAETPAGKVWYLATPAEYYGIEEVVSSGHIAIMSYDGTDWNFTDYDLIQNGYVDRQTFDNAVYDLIERLDTKVDSVVDSTPDNLPAFDGPNGVLKDSGVSVDDLVKKDGYYDTLGAGYAKTLLGNGAAVDAEFLYRTTGGEASVADGIASLKKFEGKTIVWNQLVPAYVESVNGVTITSDSGRGEASLDGTVTGTLSYNQLSITNNFTFIANHKYLVHFSGNGNYRLGVTGYSASTSSHIFVRNSTNWKGNIFIHADVGDEISISKLTLFIIDLTLMFGAGNEPSSVEEFEALFPKPYYPYNAGQLLSVKATGIKTIGVNQWDEEWELGTLDNNGAEAASANSIRAKHYIPCFPSTSYCFHSGTGNGWIHVFFYDGEKNYISSSWPTDNQTLTTPSSCRYIRIAMYSGYGTTYNHDIQIAIYHSGGDTPTTYHPYEEHLLSLPITSVTGKVNGQGTSEVVFPEGMRSAGTAFDELTDLRDNYFHGARKRMIKVNLGDATWLVRDNGIPNLRRFGTTTFSSLLKMPSANNVAFNGICAAFVTKRDTDVGVDTTGTFIAMQANGYLDIRMPSFEGDATAFKAAMNGVYLIAELATPVDYVLDTPIPCNYPAFDWSTEEVQPVGTDEDGVPMTAPIRAGIVYGPNVQDTIRRLPQDYISKGSMENLLNALKTAGIISAFTMTFDSASQKYNFTITAPINE